MSSDTTPQSGPEVRLETGGPYAGAPVPPPDRAGPERADRRRRWQVGAALLLTVVTGAATAALVSLPERTDVPGLATPNDGRYAFPELTLPPLPQGASAPAEYKIKTHAADLRGLLLPLPEGAVGTAPSPSASAPVSPSADPSATPSGSAQGSASGSGAAAAPASPQPGLPPVAGRWIPCDRDAMLAKDDAFVLRLSTDACRGAAAQGWTAADGTRTELRLLHFGSADEATDYFAGANTMAETKDIDSTHLDIDGVYPIAAGQVNIRLSDAQAGGLPTGRLCWMQSGDVVALIQLTNPKGVPAQAFRQVVALQSSMLA
ncbi:hypothetical protein HUT16_18985 [Kitasatospora sp. NA04385]|uniref:hypothetical protein n=1 Tax=Kitasatospora sp. NA04385 TaxID=2742135 RepID=UPI001592699D|nr:hypothetical protein [Kitasatospora sp. NA04385]QKW20866.1 hypothetical protein HUT16_18985 [Kitasatospora sp. NA04385]